MDAVLPFLVDGAVVLVLRVQPAARGAEDDARLGGELARELEPGLSDRLARRDKRELREAVVKRLLLAVEMRVGLVVLDLPADPDRQPVDVADVEVADPAAAFPHRLEGLGDGMAERIDRACPGDDDAFHRRGSRLLLGNQPLDGADDGGDRGDVEVGLRRARWR